MTHGPREPSGNVVVVGGGLAGLAASFALADDGWKVTLLESRPFLAGRAGSFDDPVTGETVDTCQHVTMGCCTNLARFCRRAGIDGLLRQESTLYFLDEQGRVSPMSSVPLPAPLHLAPSFLRARYLTLSEKRAAARALRSLWLTATWHDDRPFADWLTEQRQPLRVVRNYWEPVLVSALNETLDRIDYRYARQVFVEGFLSSREAGVVSIPRVPLRELYGPRLIAALAAAGVAVRLGEPVRRVVTEGLSTGNQAIGVEPKQGELLRADHVVLAVPFHRVAALVGEELAERHPPLSGLRHLESSPITSVHLWYDRPVMPWPHLVPLGRSVQWLFRRGAATGDPSDGYLQAVISASRLLAAEGNDAIGDRVATEVAAMLPLAREATLRHRRVVTERQATFSITPGIDRHRPTAASGIARLWLAGDYTLTGWPATMEGAVRSGYLAAEAIARAAGRPRTHLAPPLPAGRLACLLGP